MGTEGVGVGVRAAGVEGMGLGVGWSCFEVKAAWIFFILSEYSLILDWIKLFLDGSSSTAQRSYQHQRSHLKKRKKKRKRENKPDKAVWK
jgi:hypothetical protein